MSATNTTPVEQPPVEFDPERLAASARHAGLRLVVLYGSHARRSAHADSDLDIAVMGCRPDEFWKCYKALAKVFTGYSLDLVRLETADALFRHEIMRDAVRLYGDPDLFAGYRAFAYRDFVDSADLFALEETLSRKKLRRIREQLYDSP